MCCLGLKFKYIFNLLQREEKFKNVFWEAENGFYPTTIDPLNFD